MLVKIIEVQGQSSNNWQEAIEKTIVEASGTVRNITGVRVMNMTGTVRDGKIIEYKADVKLAFTVEQ